MELISITVEQLHRVHQALDHDRHAFVAALPEQAADALLTWQLLRQLRATPGAAVSPIDAPRRHARRRGDLEPPDDLS